MVGNTFVIIVFGSSKSLRRSLVNIFLLNQSAIDLGASLMAIITAPNKANAAGISNDLAGMSKNNIDRSVIGLNSLHSAFKNVKIY